MKLDKTYEEKVYAGVLGKLIGVYLGRPFEQWSHERIMEELGEINYYVNEQLNVPLVVTDDDITGTFTFLRALRENNYDPNISPKQIGQSWLNNLIENKTVLCWLAIIFGIHSLLHNLVFVDFLLRPPLLLLSSGLDWGATIASSLDLHLQASVA